MNSCARSSSAWKSGPYDPASASWEATGGSPGGNLLVRGSGDTNNQDTCNREGGIATRVMSTEGREEIRIEFDGLGGHVHRHRAQPRNGG